MYFLPLLRRMWLLPPAAGAGRAEYVGTIEHVALVGSAVVTATFSVVLALLAAHRLSPLNWVLRIAAEYFP
jgi:hypothetical protein